jgi:hypothetical protein
MRYVAPRVRRYLSFLGRESSGRCRGGRRFRPGALHRLWPSPTSSRTSRRRPSRNIAFDRRARGTTNPVPGFRPSYPGNFADRRSQLMPGTYLPSHGILSIEEASVNFKKVEFKYALDRRPPRRSLNMAAASEKTFGKIAYTASNAPKKAASVPEGPVPRSSRPPADQ